MVTLLLGAVCVVGATATGVVVPQTGNWDRFGLLCVTIVLARPGIFCVPQAMRRVRGRFWAGTLRPLLKWAVAGALLICPGPVVLGLRLDDELVMVLADSGIAAVATGPAPMLIGRGVQVSRGTSGETAARGKGR